MSCIAQIQTFSPHSAYHSCARESLLLTTSTIILLHHAVPMMIQEAVHTHFYPIFFLCDLCGIPGQSEKPGYCFRSQEKRLGHHALVVDTRIVWAWQCEACHTICRQRHKILEAHSLRLLSVLHSGEARYALPPRTRTHPTLSVARLPTLPVSIHAALLLAVL